MSMVETGLPRLADGGNSSKEALVRFKEDDSFSFPSLESGNGFAVTRAQSFGEDSDGGSPVASPDGSGKHSFRSMGSAGSGKGGAVRIVDPQPRLGSIASRRIPRLASLGRVMSSDVANKVQSSRGQLMRVKTQSDIGEGSDGSMTQRDLARATAYERKQKLLLEEQLRKEDELAINEDWREWRAAEKTDLPKREERYQRQIKWLTIFASVAPTYTFTAAAEQAIATERLRLLFFPMWQRRKMRRIVNAARERLNEERRAGMELPTVKALLSHKFFELWPPRVLTRLINQLEPTGFRKGEFVMQEGDPGDAMYFLNNGEVEVIIKQSGTSKARTKANGFVVATLSVGAYFGEFALLADEPRMASILCTTDTDCWALTRDVFKQELEMLQKDTPLRQSLIEISDARRRQNMKKLYALKPQEVKRLDMFRNWSDDAIKQLLERLEPDVTHTGDVVAREGEPGDSMYFIARGKMEVVRTRQGEDGVEEEMLATLQSGDIFGEVACIFLEPRCAMVRSLMNCDLWRLRKEHLMDILMGNAVILLSSKEATNRRRALWIRKLPPKYLAGCNFLKVRYPGRLKKVAQELLPLLLPRVFGASETVVERHRGCKEMLFVVSGIAKGTTTGTQWEEGGCIGDEQIMTNEPYPEAIRASTRLEVWVVTEQQLSHFLDNNPPTAPRGPVPTSTTPAKPPNARGVPRQRLHG